MNLTYSCCKCGDAVSIPETSSAKAEKLKIVCEECVVLMKGRWAGDDMFVREVDDVEAD